MLKKAYLIMCCCRKNRGGSEQSQHPKQQVNKNLCRNCQKTRLKIPIWLCLLLLLCYITTGATLFCLYQDNWTFVDAFFFAFSVIWTIGLNSNNDFNDGFFVFVCTIYLLIGLAILAMIVHLVHDCYNIPLQNLTMCFKMDQQIKSEAMNSSWVYNETPS